MFKLMGVKAGVSDYFLPLARGKYHGFWLELKRDKAARATDTQRHWLEKMKAQGYQAVLAYGHQDAIRLTKEYLGELK
jgi:hypothetical protein